MPCNFKSEHMFRLWLLASEHKPSITDVSLSPVTLCLIMCLGYNMAVDI
jgi:hypothetical protein